MVVPERGNAAETTEVCANCRGAIGRMEAAHVRHDQIVCDRCISRLRPLPALSVDYASPRSLHRGRRVPLMIAVPAIVTLFTVLIVAWFKSGTYGAAVKPIVSPPPAVRTTPTIPAFVNDDLDLVVTLDCDSLSINTHSIFGKSSWNDGLYSATDAAKDFVQTRPDGLGCDASYFSAHRAEIVKMLNGLHHIGIGTAGLLRQDKGSVKVAWIKGDRVLILSGVVLSDEFNTRATTGRERTARVIERTAIPILLRMARSTQNSTSDYLAVTIVFAARDFGEEKHSWSTDAEVVAISAPRSACDGLDSGKLTDQALVDASIVYYKGADVGGAARRISVSLR